MKYSILNEVLLNWGNKSDIESDSNAIINSKTILDKINDTPDIRLTCKFSKNERETGADRKGSGTYSACIPAKKWNNAIKLEAGNVDEWIDYITFPDIKPIAHIKFTTNLNDNIGSGWGYFRNWNYIDQILELNTDRIYYENFIDNRAPKRFGLYYEELIKYCPDELFTVNYYLKENIDFCPNGLTERMPWLQKIEFPSHNKIKVFKMGSIDSGIKDGTLRLPEGTQKIEKHFVRYCDLWNIYIPKSVKSIASHAFDVRMGLGQEKEINITIPERFKKRIPDIFFRYPKSMPPYPESEEYLKAKGINITYI